MWGRAGRLVVGVLWGAGGWAQIDEFLIQYVLFPALEPTVELTAEASRA